MANWTLAKKMGIGIALLIWAIVGTVLASIAATILGILTAYLTRGVQRRRKLAIAVTIAFPFLCIGWVGVMFVFQAFINGSYLHRDAGLGDTWTCPLPNGYALLMIDTPDVGWVYNLRTQPGTAVAEQDDAIAGVRLLQLSGRYILGASNTQFENDAKEVDSYFVLDTQQGAHASFPDLISFERKTRELGIVLKLEPIQTVYRRFRLTWFDRLVVILVFVPPIIGTVLLTTWIVILRKQRLSAK